MKEIIVTIPPDGGGAKIEAAGYGGKDCLKDCASIEEALGAVTKRTMKPESKGRVVEDRTKVGN
jgi:Protein of unknown function (DUF2997)